MTNLIQKLNYQSRQRAIEKARQLILKGEFYRNENTTCYGCGEEFTPTGRALCEACRED